MRRDPNCNRCKLSQTAKTVCLLGRGDAPSEMMAICEAPGRTEDEKGKPFVGQAGEVLGDYFDEAGIEQDDVYITNAVHCRPPNNRTPTDGQIRACKHWLDQEFDKVKPRYVLLLGNTALKSVTGKGGIKQKRGHPFEQDGTVYLPTFHPAMTFYDPTVGSTIKRDFKLFKEITEDGGIPREKKLEFTIVSNRKTFNQLLDALAGVVAFDIESNASNPFERANKEFPEHKDAKITLIGFGTRGRQWCIPWDRDASPWSEAERAQMIEELDKRLHDCLLVAQFGKFDFLWMLVHYGVHWYEHFVFDTGLAHHLLDENDRHGLKYLAQLVCGAPDWDVDKDTKMGLILGWEGVEKQCLYNAHDLYYTRQLYFVFSKALAEDKRLERVFNLITMPSARMFVEVEHHGVCININKMDAAERQLKKDVEEAKVELEKFGHVENWGSTKQLADLLFNRLHIKSTVKTATGGDSTSESAIKQMNHPIAGPILRYRKAKQYLSFFIDGWKPKLDYRRNGAFLHPSFNLHGTVTYRLSCSDPNLQQTPTDEQIRSLVTHIIKALFNKEDCYACHVCDGKGEVEKKKPDGTTKISECVECLGTGWISDDDWLLVEADLSQIELRIAAELANELTMLSLFANGKDAHWNTCLTEIERGQGQKDLVLDTGRTLLQNKKATYTECIEALHEAGADAATEINKEWKELRKGAKPVNFGYLYGMWWKRFIAYARDEYDVHVTEEQAQASRENFFSTYKFEEWHKKTKNYVRRNGYIRSMTGRKRRLPEATIAEDTPSRREAERQGINSPVQSFASDINLMAALQLREEFGRDKVRIAGTIHDSILVYVKRPYVQEVGERLQEIMRHPRLFEDFEIDLKVPLEAEVKVGPWSQGIDLKKWVAQHERSRRSTRRASLDTKDRRNRVPALRRQSLRSHDIVRAASRA